MWKIYFYALGYVRLTVLSARPTWLLAQLTNARIAMRNIEIAADGTLSLTVRKKDFRLASAICRRANAEILSKTNGGFWSDFRSVLLRPIAVGGILFAVLVGIFLPRFVFFYSVEGNDTVPSALILRELRELGVGFGTYGPSIHPQELKNKMILRIPKLSWFTVQQSGAKAVVIVRERADILPILDRKTPMDLVAARSGVVTKTELYQGNLLCKTGDAVLKGDTLVSAYKDLEFTTEVSTAVAEVYARTKHRYQVCAPAEYEEKRPKLEKRYYSVVIGQKRYNFFFGSSISGLCCDKITKRVPITLPGGYKLPISIEITTKTDYDTEKQPIDPASAAILLEDAARDYTKSQMIAGTILSQNAPREKDLQKHVYRAQLTCEEMIGRLQPAKELKEELTDDGKND